MKILIIGSKGFIGTHAVSYFLQKQYEVWECDVVVDYTSKQYIQVDATNADYSEIFQENRFDVCINCSGAASVPDSLNHPQRDFMLNTVNVFKMLDAIRRFNPECKFINLSSAAVYGNPKVLPIKEEQTLNPLSPYGFHKKYAEEICQEFSNYFQIKTCSLRIFSAYGEGLKKQIFWDLYQKTKGTDQLTLFGTGKESRDFIHVQDIVKIIDIIISQASFKGETLNVANGTELKIETIAHIFADKMGWNGRIKFSGEGRKGDPSNWVANISLIKEMGYEQTIDIETGIEKYALWLKENK